MKSFHELFNYKKNIGDLIFVFIKQWFDDFFCMLRVMKRLLPNENCVAMCASPRDACNKFLSRGSCQGTSHVLYASQFVPSLNELEWISRNCIQSRHVQVHGNESKSSYHTRPNMNYRWHFVSWLFGANSKRRTSYWTKYRYLGKMNCQGRRIPYKTGKRLDRDTRMRWKERTEKPK